MTKEGFKLNDGENYISRQQSIPKIKCMWKLELLNCGNIQWLVIRVAWFIDFVHHFIYISL